MMQIWCRIELKNVYYKYQDNDKWAIDDLSLKIEKGKQIDFDWR